MTSPRREGGGETQTHTHKKNKPKPKPMKLLNHKYQPFHGKICLRANHTINSNELANVSQLQGKYTSKSGRTPKAADMAHWAT